MSTETETVAVATDERELTVVIDSTESNDRIMTVTIDKNKTVLRKTTIRFKGDRGDLDLIDFFTKRGIRMYTTRFDNCYYDMGHYVGHDTVKALERHGIPVEHRIVPNRSRRWGTIEEIRNMFDMHQASFEFWTYSIDVSTFNLTETEHIAEIQKLYVPMKQAGYVIDHSCATEIINGSC